MKPTLLIEICMKSLIKECGSLGATVWRKICGFSVMHPRVLAHIWRHLIDCVGSVLPVECIFVINFKF